MQRLMALLVAIFTATLTGAQTVEVAPATPAARALQSLVLSDSSREGAQVRNFYGPAGYRLVWSRGAKPTAQALTVIGAFEAAAEKGLRPADYAAARMRDLRDDAARARFDYLLTATLVRYANDLRMGRVTRSLDSSFDLPSCVARASSGDASAAIAAAEPQHAGYRGLINALATYRGIAASDTEALPVVSRLSAGDAYPALPQLAAKLRLLGDLGAEADVSATTYEGALVDAVQHFQSRHGLEADGILAKNTFAQLNVPASQRVQQLEVALERVRATPVVPDGPTIIVNIPEFRLRAVGETELGMRVVVGKAAGHKTPVFDGELQHVVFRPYWNVPPSIQRTEVAPKLTSAYAARNNYEVVDGAGRVQSIDEDVVSRVRKGQYQVRQKPGTSNALGLVKFLFPNDNNVYLHSTPQQSLFARERRDFSHGCVRVEDPAALAQWVLREKPGWTREKIDAALKGTKDNMYVNPAQPITVRIVYQTATAQPNGDVHFFADIYGHDAKLIAQMAPAPVRGAVMVAAK